MKATIKQVNRYEVVINGKTFINLQKQDEWEGMIKFIGPNGQTLIVDQASTITSFLDAVFDNGVATEVTIVKASPGLLVP